MTAVETKVNISRQAHDSSDGSFGEAEFVRLYRQYGPCALYRIHAIVRDRGVAEEILQDAMLAVKSHAGDFDGSKGCVGTWFLTIARNRALDHVRSNANRIAQHSVSVMSWDRPVACWILADLEASERAQRLRAALMSLPKNQQIVIQLGFFEDLSGSQIALKLGEPLGTIKTRMRSALKNLRNLLVVDEEAFSHAA
jgi:RNA polymerase sigma-70 factor, ECF subfamily